MSRPLTDVFNKRTLGLAFLRYASQQPNRMHKIQVAFFRDYLCFSLPTIDASLLSSVGVRKVGPVLAYVVVQSHCYSCQKVFEGHGYVCVQTVDRGVLVSWASECTNTNGPSK